MYTADYADAFDEAVKIMNNAKKKEMAKLKRPSCDLQDKRSNKKHHNNMQIS